MADDAKLQIILEAVNQTASPFNDLVASLESLQKTAAEVAKSVGDAVGSIAAAASQMDSGVSKDMEAAGRSVSTFQKSASEELNAANKSFNDVKGNMEKGIKEIGGLVAIQMLGQSMEELGKKGEHLFDFAVEQGADFQQSMQNIKTVIAANADGTGTWSDKLQGAAGMTDQLQQKALDLGSRGAQSANQVAEAMDTMLRAGVDAKTVLGGAAEAAQNVSIVTGDKLDESANLVTEIYHQFRESFAENGKSVQENMKTTGDVLTGTLLSARINSQDFLDTLKYVGPVASQLGSSFLDTATATAVLAQNGIKGSQAGNNLKRALTNLLEPTKQGAEAMSKLGLIQHGHNMLIDESTGKMKNLTQIQEILHKSMDGLTEAKKAQYIHDIFGQYALAGTLVLANENSEAFSKLKEHIGSVSAEQAAASMLNTFSGHMAQLKAHVETTAKEFGMAFIPVLEKLVPIGQKVLSWLQELTPANKEFLMAILGIGSALAVVGGALATFAISLKFAKEGMAAIKDLFMVQAAGEEAISIFKRFATTMREVGMAEAFAELFSPAVWIALAVAAVIAATVAVIQNWDKIKAATIALGNKLVALKDEAIEKIKEAFVAAGTFIKDKWQNMIDGVKNAWIAFKTWISDNVAEVRDAVVDAFKWMYDHNYYFKDLVDAITDAWNAVVTGTKKLWGDLKTWINTTFTDISNLANSIFSPMGDFFSGIWSDISSGASNRWNEIKSTMSTLWNGIITDAEDIFNGLGTFFSNLWNEAENWGFNLVHMVGQGIRNAASEVADAAKDVAGSIANFLGFHSPTPDGPAQDSDTWAPNFVKMFAGGLAAGAGQVANAANTLISPLRDIMGGGVDSQDQLKKVKAISEGIVNAKNIYTEASMHNDAAAMEQAHQMAEKYRADLQQMGFDAKEFGADKDIRQVMDNMQIITYKTMQNMKQVQKDMTQSMSTNNALLSANTQLNTNNMSDSWSNTTFGVLKQTADMSNGMSQILSATRMAIDFFCTHIQSSFSNAFHSIAASATDSMNRVVQAVNMARAAMASMGGGGSFGVSMAGPSYSTMNNIAMSPIMPPIMASGGASVVNHITVNANGNITQNEQALGNIVSKALIDKMKFQGKIG